MVDIPTPDKDFRKKTLRGIQWSVISQIGDQAISFTILIILARLLSPGEFGLIAMVTVITSFAGIFAEMGFSSALVQKQDIEQTHLSSVFWLNLGVGILLSLAFVAGAPLIAQFYDQSILGPLTVLIAANFTIGSLSIVQKTMMTKTLDFRRLSIVNIVAGALSGIIAIVMAYRGAGVWSLAAQSISSSLITTIMLWRLGKWRPSFIFDWNAIKDLLNFSLNLFGTQMLNYWVRNLDYLLIGRFLGTQPLGVYRNAYMVMLFPLRNVSRVLSRVMFPSLSLIQRDKARVRSVFVRATRTIALVTFPMMIGLWVVVEPFVLAIFGPQWTDMIPILQIFCVTGLMESIGTLNGNLFLSQGRADLQFRLGLVLKATTMAGILIGLQWGVMGVAIGYATSSLINSYPSLFFAGRLVGLTYWQVWRGMLGILGCALGMAVAVWGIGLLLPIPWPHWLRLAVQVPFGIVVYGALIHLFRVRAYQETWDLLLEQVRQRFKAKKPVSATPVASESSVDSH